MKTANEIKLLVAAINKGEVSVDQLAEMKVVMAETFTSGEIPTGDQIVILQYVSKQLVKVKTEGEKEAEKAAKLAEAEAIYKKDLQAHKIEVRVLVEKFVTTKMFNKKGTFVFSPQNKGQVKTYFDDFVKTLPAEPKKPVVGKTGTTSTSTGNEYKPVSKIGDGSTNATIRDLIVANDGIEKKALLDLLVKQLPDRKKSVLQMLLGRAIGGQLENWLVIGVKGDLHWDENKTAPANEPELETESEIEK